MWRQVSAIVWAQWRAIWNSYPRASLGGSIFTVAGAVLWYGMCATGAVGAAFLLASPGSLPLFPRLLPGGFLLAMLYWQAVPILLATAGASLDLKKVRVYPVPNHQLFAIEVALRLSTALEVLLILTGAAVGLSLNPALPAWAPLGLAPFVALNLFLSAGLRDLFGRWLARKRVREIAVFLLVLAAALPQLLLVSGVPAPLRRLFERQPHLLWPWNAAAGIASGEAGLLPWVVLAGWTAAAYLFGRWQFEKTLDFDAQAANATAAAPSPLKSWTEALFRLPARVFHDPLGALVEKEIRFLARAPRFRLLFLMGFSFGLIVWLPLTLGGRRSPDSWLAQHFLTVVSVYALMLIGEVAFYNSFGFDRAAVQLYFLAPVKLATVLAAKNIAAAVFVLLEIAAVAAASLALPEGLGAAGVAEAFAVAVVLVVYMLALGNLSSVYYPRPVDPAQSWRSGAIGRFQAMLLLVYPLLGSPVMLAYLAEWALDSQAAFYAVLAVAASVGAVFYWVSLESAVAAAGQRIERLAAALAGSQGPVSG